MGFLVLGSVLTPGRGSHGFSKNILLVHLLRALRFTQVRGGKDRRNWPRLA